MKQNICRNQHYIPQMLLRGFAKNRKTIAIYKKDKTYTDNVKNVAMSRDFYSSPQDMSLDDSITEHEAKKLQHYLSLLRELENDSAVTTEIATEVIHFLCIRTKFFRDIFNFFGQYIITQVQGDYKKDFFKDVSEKLNSRLESAVSNEIDKIYANSKEQIQLPKEVAKKLTLSIVEKNPSIIQGVLNKTFQDMPILMEQASKVFPSAMKNAHTTRLLQLYDVKKTPEYYRSLDWKVIKDEVLYDFILPDCLSLAVTDEGIFPNMIANNANNIMILFPINRHTMLVGTKGNIKFDLALFNQYAAENSFELFICHPELNNAYAFQTNLGNSIKKFLIDNSTFSITDYFKK